MMGIECFTKLIDDLNDAERYREYRNDRGYSLKRLEKFDLAEGKAKRLSDTKYILETPYHEMLGVFGTIKAADEFMHNRLKQDGLIRSTTRKD